MRDFVLRFTRFSQPSEKSVGVHIQEKAEQVNECADDETNMKAGAHRDYGRNVSEPKPFVRVK